MKREFCDNCNAKPNAVLSRVRIMLGDDDRMRTDITPGNSAFDKWLCAECAGALGSLDFAELIKRHDKRPRTMELP